MDQKEADVTPTPTLDTLQAMSVEQFAQLVSDNVQRPDSASRPKAAVANDELWKLLLSADLLQRTYQVLIRLLRTIDDGLAERKAAFQEFTQKCYAQGEPGKALYFEKLGEHEAWRSGQLRRKRLLTQRHLMAKQAVEKRRSEGQIPSNAPNVFKARRNYDLLFKLAYAVVRHRDAAAEEDLVALPHDLELWELADKLSVTFGDGSQMPLADWVERAMARPDFRPPDV